MRVFVLLGYCVFVATAVNAGVGSTHYRQLMGISPNGNFAVAEDDARSATSAHDASKSSSQAAVDVQGASVSDVADTVHVSKIMREEKAEAIPGGPSSDEDDGKQKEFGLLFTVIQMVIVFTFAFLYKRGVVDAYPRESLQAMQPQTGQTDFKQGLCGCTGDKSVCLHATCCWAVRAAHTWDVMGIADFWVGVVVSVFCGCCLPCIGGLVWRAQMREKFGIEKNSINDFLMWWCCLPCAVGQEAMQVDEVVGMSVECCCNLVPVAEGAQPLLQSSTPAPKKGGYATSRKAAGSSEPVNNEPVNNEPVNNEPVAENSDMANAEGSEPKQEEEEEKKEEEPAP